eukprot:1147190-Pelagomonas_calceolata.AAC.4
MLPGNRRDSDGQPKISLAITTHTACIYDTKENVQTSSRLQTMLQAYSAARQAGLHTSVQPPVQNEATEVMGLLHRYTLHLGKGNQKTKASGFFFFRPACCAHQHISSEPSRAMQWSRKKSLQALLTMTLSSQHAGAKEYLGPTLIWYLEPNSQVSPFATLPMMTNSYYIVMHAPSSVANTDITTVTFMLLLSQMDWTKKGYTRWFSCYPDHATALAKFPSEFRPSNHLRFIFP